MFYIQNISETLYKFDYELIHVLTIQDLQRFIPTDVVAMHGTFVYVESQTHELTQHGYTPA